MFENIFFENDYSQKVDLIIGFFSKPNWLKNLSRKESSVTKLPIVPNYLLKEINSKIMVQKNSFSEKCYKMPIMVFH